MEAAFLPWIKSTTRLQIARKAPKILSKMFEIKSEAENAHQQVWAFTVEPPPLLISLQILANSFFSNQLSPQLSHPLVEQWYPHQLSANLWNVFADCGHSFSIWNVGWSLFAGLYRSHKKIGQGHLEKMSITFGGFIFIPCWQKMFFPEAFIGSDQVIQIYQIFPSSTNSCRSSSSALILRIMWNF